LPSLPRLSLIAAGALLISAQAWSQTNPPADASDPTDPSATAPNPIPDAPAATGISLLVDATDSARHRWRVKEVLPVTAGKLDLVYPKWIPGDHAPTGPLENVTGLHLSANGETVAWTRDPVDLYRLHATVPDGISQLEVDFEFITPGDDDSYGQEQSTTPQMLVLPWNEVLFYPADTAAASVTITPSLKLPRDWHAASSLNVSTTDLDGTLHYQATDVDTLVDSPVMAGRYLRHYNLGNIGSAPVSLDVASDEAYATQLSDEQLAQHRALVAQTGALFGVPHFHDYDFLLALSDHISHYGLEHHQSSENRLEQDFLTDDDSYFADADLLPHEFVHSWNGKYRRPADLLTSDFQKPMQDTLLWVYEGLTEYWGSVLTARSGLRSASDYRDWLALNIATMAATPGREWRNLQDTATATPLILKGPSLWANRARGLDYYPEGALLWLEVDASIRQLSHGQKSLDDFARAFAGQNAGQMTPQPYDFDQIVATLNAIQPNDWAGLLKRRLDSTDTTPPVNGIELAGWTLDYSDTPSHLIEALQTSRGEHLLWWSAGFNVDDDGKLSDVQWDSAADHAGLAPGMTILAVNGLAFTTDRLERALRDSGSSHEPIKLIARNGDAFLTVNLPASGLRYPVLKRIDGFDDMLGDIVKPLPVASDAAGASSAPGAPTQAAMPAQ